MGDFLRGTDLRLGGGGGLYFWNRKPRNPTNSRYGESSATHDVECGRGMGGTVLLAARRAKTISFVDDTRRVHLRQVVGIFKVIRSESD